MLGSLLMVFALAACRSGSAGQGDRPGDSARAAVDPQVLQDVVEFIMPLPGEASQARGNRVLNFHQGLMMRRCGATPPPLDYINDTGGSDYPSLEWIRERGLGIIYDPVSYYGLDANPYDQPQNPECNGTAPDGSLRKEKVVEDVPGDQKFVTALAPTWDEMERTVENEPASLALKAPLATCLRAGSGLTVDPDMPYVSWLLEVDKSVIRKKDPVSKDTAMRWSVLYADCAAAYFDHVRERLTEERPALIERNREAIETYAAAIVELGYTP